MADEPIFQVEAHGGYVLLRVTHSVGSLFESQLEEEIVNVLKKIEQAGCYQVIADFEAAPYFGSSLLKTMVQIWQKVQARGGRLMLVNVSEVGREVLSVGRFDTIWEIYPSREEALESLSP